MRLCNAAANFAFLCKAALNLLRMETSRKISLPKKRKACAWNRKYLATVLGGRVFDALALLTI